MQCQVPGRNSYHRFLCFCASLLPLAFTLAVLLSWLTFRGGSAPPPFPLHALYGTCLGLYRTMGSGPSVALRVCRIVLAHMPNAQYAQLTMHTTPSGNVKSVYILMWIPKCTLYLRTEWYHKISALSVNVKSVFILIWRRKWSLHFRTERYHTISAAAVPQQVDIPL